ncbi:MAG: HU family DNA-binding protein [Phycisphaerae bacterium]|nr:HU family DNA-binding protein [Phycisphaerae bacterium]
MAKKASNGGSPKPRGKSEIYNAVAGDTGLSRKQVASVFESLSNHIKKDLGKGPGVFAVPGLMKITVVKKPAVKAGTRPNPFKPGEMMQVKARPARKVVKVRPLKALKDMV